MSEWLQKWQDYVGSLDGDIRCRFVISRCDGALCSTHPSRNPVEPRTSALPDRITHAGTRCEFSNSLNDRHSSSQLFGVPEFARLGIVGEKTLRSSHDPLDTMIISAERVFRQYVRQENDCQEILATAVLIPGMRCFYETGGPHGVPYVDLRGVFATTPEFMPDKVGVPDSRHYVDFTFHPGTGIAHLSRNDDRYWMVPGVPQRFAWFREYYQVWVNAGRPDVETSLKKLRDSGYKEWKFAYHVHQFIEIDAQGGLPEPTRLPIRVVGQGHV